MNLNQLSLICSKMKFGLLASKIPNSDLDHDPEDYIQGSLHYFHFS